MHTATICFVVVLVAVIVCTHAIPLEDLWRQTASTTDDKRGKPKLKLNQFHHLGIGKRRDTSVSAENRSELERLLVKYFLQVLDSEMSRQMTYPGQQEIKDLVDEDM
ncbi:uncharacterized protein LOC144447780 [Glandiceps talaboti]